MSTNGMYEFDPAMLAQIRPPEEQENPILYGQSSINHERTHWFQFCGSTIGSLFMAMSRAEDLLLLDGLSSASLDKRSTDFLKKRFRSSLPLLPVRNNYTAISEDIPMELSSLGESFRSVRLSKTLLMDSARQWQLEILSRGTLLLEAIGVADRVYTRHTGGIRDRHSNMAERVFHVTDIEARPSVAHGSELTTRHLFETGAFINEWAPFLRSGWGGIRQTGARFHGFTHEVEYELTDALANARPLYRLCIEYALQKWKPLFSAVSRDDVPAQLSHIFPTLACCIDIAINPPVPPICIPAELEWEDLYPPARFLASVESVKEIGLFPEWPDNSSYMQYRQSVIDHSGRTIGVLAKRNFQHPRFTAEFFTTVTFQDELIWTTSYFDYLIWVMESLHLFRGKYPLQWAVPFLCNIRSEDFDPVESHLRNRAFTYAPLIRAGEDLAGSVSVSEDFAYRLLIDLCSVQALKKTASIGFDGDLSDFVPDSIGTDPDFRETISYGLANATGLKFFLELASMSASLEGAFVSPEPDPGDDSLFEEARVRPGKKIQIKRVSRSAVRRKDLSEINRLFGELRNDPLDNLRSVEFSFDGYAANHRGLWDLPEINEFLRKFQDDTPMWAWYIPAGPDPREYPTFSLILLSSFDNPRNISSSDYETWLRKKVLNGLIAEAASVSADKMLVRNMILDILDAASAMRDARLP